MGFFTGEGVSPQEARTYFHRMAINVYHGMVGDKKDIKEGLKLKRVLAATKENKLAIADMHEYHYLRNSNKWTLTKVFGGALLMSIGVCIWLLN